MNAPRTIACIAAALCATTLHAQTMSLTDDIRYIEVSSEYQTVDDEFGFDVRTSTPDIPFAGWQDSTAVDIGRASASADMSSLLSDTTMLATGSADAQAVYDVDTSVFTIAFATSRHIVGFSLNQSTTFSLVADLVATTYAESFVNIRQDTRFGDLLHEYTISDGTLSINEHITLDAGTYYLEFRAESDHEHHQPADTIGHASFDAAWTIVPAPATALLPLAGLALSVRRRR